MSLIKYIDKDGNEKTKFDLRTHIKDPKTGFVTKVQPYRLVIDRERGTTFERNGILYHPNGQLVNPPAKAPAAPPPAPAKVTVPGVTTMGAPQGAGKNEGMAGL